MTAKKKKGVRQVVLFNPIEHKPGESLERHPSAYAKVIESAIKLADMARNMKAPLKKRVVLYPPTKCGRATAFQLGLLFHAKLEEVPALLGETPHDGLVKEDEVLAEIIRKHSQEYDCLVLVANVHAASDFFVTTRLEEILGTEFPFFDFTRHIVVWENSD